MAGVTQAEMVSVLCGARGLEGLDAERFGPLIEAGELMSFEAGEVLYDRGEVADRGFILISGRVELVEAPYPGRRLASQLFTAGGLFSENGFIKGWPHKHSCRAIEATEALAVSTQAFRALLDAGDVVTMRIVDELLNLFVHDLRGTNQRLDEIFSRPDRTLTQLRDLIDAE